MALPKTLKHFNMFIDGRGYAGRVEEVQLPKLSRKMIEYSAGGMLGPIEMDMGMEKLDGELTLAEFSRELLVTFGICDASGVLLRFRGAAIADDADCTTSAIEVVMRGRFKEIDMGTAKHGEKGQMKLSYTLTRFEYHENDVNLIEIDLINMIENINGVDRTKQTRDALAL